MTSQKPSRPNAGDRPDPDNPEWTERDFERARPASEVVGKAAASALVRKRGRPAMDPSERKQQVTMRLSPDVLEAMRASGEGWQARADKVLRKVFIEHEGAVTKPRRVTGAVRLSEELAKAAKALGTHALSGQAVKRQIVGSLTGRAKESDKRRA